MPILYLQSCTHRWHNQQCRNPWWRNQRGFGLNRFGLTGYCLANETRLARVYPPPKAAHFISHFASHGALVLIPVAAMAQQPPPMDEAARLERRRKQCRVSQRRYRDKKGSTEYNLKLDVNGLRESVQSLKGLRELLETKIWSSKLAQNAAVLKAVEQYYAVFEQGLHNPEAGGENVRKCFEMQLGFLGAFLDPHVQFGDAVGLRDVLEQWHRYTQFHAWIETSFVSAEVFGSTNSPVVVAQGTLTVLMNRMTLEKIYPRALDEPELASMLLDHVVEYRTTTTFSFNERAQVERLDWEVDFLGGLSNLFGSAIDASLVLQGALLAEGSKLSARIEEDTSDGRRQRGMVDRELDRAALNLAPRPDLGYSMA
ncbi:unnamed protein product [Phytophthora lilii]|uniref:Unnamed protein product n=1 Tax=Phytophthora lilii TaxID=2077276 RepID=A0A9W6XCV5_9STRA|nr:unnamed protein product [Phytophthora lilii]